MITLTGTKQREETYGLIAKTWDSCVIGDIIEVTQPNNRGGKTLEKTLKLYFPSAQTDSRDKSRIITLTKTDERPDIIDEWLEHTQLRLVEKTGFYSVPGLFGWERVDKGSALLLKHLSDLKGIGADFGCGYGYLSRHILEHYIHIKKLSCVDNDPRAVEACTMNVQDSRAQCIVADCTMAVKDLDPLDFIVMNPPFHDGATENREIGQHFIENAARHLKKSGALWVVANRHLPYEKTLARHFKMFETLVEQDGFKILKALK